ncbi:uncharacterized protein LTR77_010103 [Saxophila tyrrhenica]|uniref:Uncharacterized protein n=1 Tax=Saxophila tyrrhenica TaxID=1690608 RepID=A0AAV9NZA4_9PEZI|nr:hypothetical protein LTR77_010103 [Saxophila tyrrhenica]
MLTFYCSHPGPEKPLDQLTSYVADFYKTGEVTVRLVLACEIFVDIFFVLRDGITSPFVALDKFADQTSSWLKRDDVHAKVLGCNLGDEYHATATQRLKPFVERSVKRDVVAEFKLEFGNSERSHDLAPFALLKHHPILCGMMLFHISRTRYHLGTSLSSARECMMAVMHMYNAALQKGHLVKQWPDIETIIGFYGAHHVFVGDRSVTSQSPIQRLQFAFRTSPTAMRQKVRSIHHLAIGRGVHVTSMKMKPSQRRQMHENTPLLAALPNVYHEKGCLRRMEQSLNPGPDFPSTRYAKAWKAKNSSITSTYLEVNYHCVELLKRFKDILVSIPRSPFASHLKSNKDLYCVAYTVLLFEEPEFTLVGDTSEKLVSLLKMAATQMETVIDRAGSKANDSARALCPTHVGSASQVGSLPSSPAA